MNRDRIQSRRLCLTYELGIIEYSHVMQIQQRLVNTVIHRNFDVLLLLEHPPCLTIGRFRGEEDIIASPEILAREGISIFHTDRGGGVTYHGPGQLVGYPILNLRKNKLGIRQYIWKLEEVIIKTLADLDIYGGRLPKHPGVWVGKEKVCSIGLRIIQGVAMHGFALNVNPNLSHFEFIHSCGITDKKITSVSRLMGYEVKVEEIKESLLQAFSQVFHFDFEIGDEREEIIGRGTRRMVPDQKNRF
jgi:lipoyl(octanoyl) transferase